MLKSLVKSAINTVFHRRMPPTTPLENAAIDDLRATFREMPPRATEGVPPTQAAWLQNTARLRDLVLNGNPREFLRWDVVTYTMFVMFASYTRTELRSLRRRPDWATRWRHAIRESVVGNPIPCVIHPSSSSNLIHHAYHVAQFEEKTGLGVQDVDFVFEFGGGYGSMCRLFNNLGFRGTYVIFDLPEFSALQAYYLTTLGLTVHTDRSPARPGEQGVVCTSDLERVGELIASRAGPKNSVFVGTWSISESPVALRDRVLPLTDRFLGFLIAYQDQFGEADNRAFFDAWKATRPDVQWTSWKIPHLPFDSYLVGRRGR